MKANCVYRFILMSNKRDVQQDGISILLDSDSLFSGFDKEKIIIDVVESTQTAINQIKKANEEEIPYTLATMYLEGFELDNFISVINEIDPYIPLILCTDKESDALSEKINKRHNCITLKKPCNSDVIKQMIPIMIKNWELQKESEIINNSFIQSVEQQTRSLENSLSLVRATFESSADGILVINKHGKISDYNNKFVEMWGARKILVNKKDYNLLIDHIVKQILDEKKLLKTIKEFQSYPDAVGIDLIKLKDDRIYEYYSQPQKLQNTIIGRIWSFRDVTQRIKLQEKLKYQATHDLLTNLPNQIALHEQLQKNIAASELNHSQFALLSLDLDRFKIVNDTLSHFVGDELLIAVAKRLKEVVRANDFLSRLGGDEFVLILSDISNIDSVTRVATKILEAIQKPFHISGREIMITTSIGIAAYPKDGLTIKELLRNADSAMHYAKEYGMNQYHFYNDKMYEQNFEIFEKESELRRAVINNEFLLYYQPQFDLNTEKLVGVEVLIRWMHPTRGIVQPLDFLPLAEETGLIFAMGEWTLRTACQRIKKWQESGLPIGNLSVNISPIHLQQYNFVKNLVEILSETNLDPECLKLEVKEIDIINNESILNTISVLRNLGIRFTLDDFGTGYSSINFLRKAPINCLKIDKSFIQNINLNAVDDTIIHAIIEMAQSLNIEVIAEGVETEEQFNYLKSHKCGVVQGFYYSRPLSEQDFEEMLFNSVELNKLLIKEQ